MRALKVTLLIMVIIVEMLLLSGCWNYREIDQLAIVAGVAIDKGQHEKFSITVEIVEVSGGREAETRSKLLTIEGRTIFDAVRHMISISGKKLYWSHAKIAIISSEIAKEGIVQILDWFHRDAETRSDIHVLISEGKTAKEILSSEGTTNKVTSFEIDEVIKNEKILSNAPDIEISDLANYMDIPGVGSTITAIAVMEENGVSVPHVMGTAIMKGDRLLGFIDGEETRGMLFIKNEVKSGVLVVSTDGMDVSLEIFGSRTKIRPVINDGEIEMKIYLDITVAIDEIGGTRDVINENASEALSRLAENELKSKLYNIIKKIQTQFGVDIFGFGAKLREENPKGWKKVEDKWEDEFTKLKVNIDAKVRIKNSAMLAKPLKVGD